MVSGAEPLRVHSMRSAVGNAKDSLTAEFATFAKPFRDTPPIVVNEPPIRIAPSASAA
jgi:hypothetical protein